MYRSLAGAHYCPRINSVDSARTALSQLEEYIDSEQSQHPRTMRLRHAQNMLWAIYRGTVITNEVYGLIDEFHVKHFGDHAPMPALKEKAIQRRLT